MFHHPSRHALAIAMGLLVCVSTLAASAGVSLSVVGATAAADCPDERLPHPPILIRSDDGFTRPGSGVVSGSGTANDPYVIEGWSIRPDILDGILLDGTSAHVVIRCNTIHDARLEIKTHQKPDGSLLDRDVHAGIYLRDAANVRIEHNQIVNNAPTSLVIGFDSIPWPGTHGVSVEFSQNVAIVGNNIDRTSGIGIHLRGSANVLVEDNTVARNSMFGVSAGLVDDLVIRHNTFRGHDSSMGSVLILSSSPRVVVESNDIRENQKPTVIAVWPGSTNARIQGNEIRDGGLAGVYVNAPGALVQGNNIVGNGVVGVAAGDGITVDATHNWWGCATGPGTSGCDTVDGDVQFTPWETQEIDTDAGAP